MIKFRFFNGHIFFFDTNKRLQGNTILPVYELCDIHELGLKKKKRLIWPPTEVNTMSNCHCLLLQTPFVPAFMDVTLFKMMEKTTSYVITAFKIYYFCLFS